MGKFDDMGFFGPNKFKKKDSHPSHTGLVNLSHDTLKALLAAYQDTGEAKLEIAGWRKKDKPDQISLKVQLPKEREDGDRDSRGRGRSDERSRGSYRRDDRDPEERRFSEGEGRRRSYDEEPPFEDRRSSRRDDRGESRYSRGDYGDDRDL